MRTVEIPGGHATLVDQQDEMTPRRRRPVELLTARLGGGRLVKQMALATRVLVEGDVVIDNTDAKHEDGTPKFGGGDVEIKESDLALVMRLNDATIASLLVGWTINHPVPRTEAEVGDIPIAVYEALRQHCAIVNAEMSARRESGEGGFTVDSVEDAASPTGD